MMQTTLRLQDRVYRAAKAEAARHGVYNLSSVHPGLDHRQGKSRHMPMLGLGKLVD